MRSPISIAGNEYTRIEVAVSKVIPSCLMVFQHVHVISVDDNQVDELIDALPRLRARPAGYMNSTPNRILPFPESGGADRG